MKSKLIGVVAVTMAMCSVLADPSIALTSAKQRYPWNGKVDLDYTIAGVTSPDDYYVRFKVARASGQQPETLVCASFDSVADLLRPVDGSHRAKWNSTSDAARFEAESATFTAELVYAPAGKEKSPYAVDYMVIDVSAGSEAQSYPVAYEKGLGGDSSKYNADAYKTGKIVFRRIKAGSFMMGSPESEPGRETDYTYNMASMARETRHKVTLTKDYWLTLFPITRRQYFNVTGVEKDVDAGSDQDADQCPVQNVSYQDLRGASFGVAVPIDGRVDEGLFFGRLRARTGIAFDLPTEAQWERACRADTETAAYFGASATRQQVFDNAWISFWILGQYRCTPGNAYPSGSTTPKVHAVGLHANPWGLFDLFGNVWELCLYRVATNTAENDLGSAAVTDPLTQVAGGNVVFRGGAYSYTDDRMVRAAARFGRLNAQAAAPGFGFRAAAVIAE